MKIKKILLISLPLFLMRNIFCLGSIFNTNQNSYDNYNYSSTISSGLNSNATIYITEEEKHYINVGDRIYSNNYHGLEEYMKYLKKNNSILYNEIYSDFNCISNKIESAKTNDALVYGLGLGAILGLVGGMLYLNHDSQIPSIASFSFFSVSLISLTVYAIIKQKQNPNEDDYLNFFNKHNEISEKNKIKISIAPSPNGMGLFAHLNF